jgi:recombination protein RecA
MAKDKAGVRDELATVLAASLNKQFKDYKVAHFLDGSEDTPTDLTEWISTGSSTLDLAIANRPHGGIPVGRITEITGLEASGKSLLAAHLLANTQKKDGLAVYIDTENAMNEEFLRAIGMDVSKMLYVQLETIEDIFESIENIINKVRESSKDRLVTIVVDSLAGASTKVEMEADYEKDGWATSKAIILSKAMRKVTQMIGRQRICLVFTNQLRQKLGVMFGDPWTTSGGKAVGFHSSCRLRLKSMGQLKTKVDKQDVVVGMKTSAQVIKNRMGPPLRKAEFEILFESGVDDYGGWLNVLKNHKLVTQSGAWYGYTDTDTGEIHKFLSKDWKGLLEGNEDLKNQIYQKMCDVSIMKYKTDKLGVDDIDLSDEPVPEG